ncbi:hypothetical protein HAX54_040201, partial [Datura stramonium]|nr:hypothetical protein [Datura stramonium]
EFWEADKKRKGHRPTDWPTFKTPHTCACNGPAAADGDLQAASLMHVGIIWSSALPKICITPAFRGSVSAFCR